MKTCSRCGIQKTPSDFYADKSKSDGRHSVCKECVKAARRAAYAADPEKYKARMKVYAQSDRGKRYKKELYLRLRTAALNAYGGECACCGEMRDHFLTVDHVGGWGARHRKEIGSGASNIYQWLKKAGYPQDGTIQLLCWNCNCAIGIYGSCPHTRSS